MGEWGVKKIADFVYGWSLKEVVQIESFGDTEKLRSGSMPSKSDKLAVQTVQTMPVVQSVFVFFRERSRSGCYNLAGEHPFITSAKD